MMWAKVPLHSNLTRPPPHKQRSNMMGTCSFVRKDKIINAYYGSLFTLTSVSRLGLDSHYFLYIGMDGPTVNWAFTKSLDSILRMTWVAHFWFHLNHAHFTLSKQHLEKDLRHCYLTLTVSLMIYTFFKLSSARKEDYACLKYVTNASAAHAMKHTETK